MFGINSERRFPTERFSRAGIERERDGVEVFLGIDRQVRPFWHVLAQQPIRVFVGAALPGTVRVSKVDLHASAFGQDFVAMHFTALVVGHGFAHRRRLTVEHGREAVDDRAGAGIVHLGQHHKTGGALDQRSHRGAVAFALDQVTLPVARDQAILDLGRADVNALHILDLAPAVDATAARLAHLVVMTQAGDQLALQLAAWMQIDRVVDRLVRDRFVGVVGPHGSQYVRNLLRRPECVQALPYNLEERAIDVELGRAPRCDTTRVTLLVGQVCVVGSRSRRPAQFTADRTGRATKTSGNGSDTALVVAHGHHDGAFLRRQMGIDFRHGSTLQEAVLHLVLEIATSNSL